MRRCSPSMPTAGRRVLPGAFALVMIVLVSLGSGAVDIDGVKVTLQSQKYYAKWDMTRLVYRVKSASVNEGDSWILGMGDCVTPESIDAPASSLFGWSETPFRGLRFERTATNQKFYLWLYGPWEIGTAPISVGGIGEEPSVGEVDGPSCGNSGISIDVISGGAIAFPELSSQGSMDAGEETLLRVVAASSGWALSHTLAFDLPSGASEETVRRIFQVTVSSYATGAGVTEVAVAYGIEIQEEDLLGLPQGEYGVTIAFTVSTD